MPVPVPDLLQMTHPGYSMVESELVISENHLPMYLEFCRCVTERFEHYGELKIIPPDLFKLLAKSFETVFEDDNPLTFFPAYHLIPRLLEEFEYTIENMTSAFQESPRIMLFYRKIAEKLRQCFQYHIQGDNT